MSTQTINSPGGQAAQPYALSRPAHALLIPQIIQELDAHLQDGLMEEDANGRLKECGPNRLPEVKPTGWFVMLVKQVGNAMTLVLLAAMAVSFGIKAKIEGVFIGIVILMNILVGFCMDIKGAKEMNALKSLGSPTVNVVRNGEAKVMDTEAVVPGDLVELKVGDAVPADVRLIETFNLEVKEMNITGESNLIHKDAHAILDDDAEISDRKNIVFHSTTVEKGRARGIVYATGANSQVGSMTGDDDASNEPVENSCLGKVKRFALRTWDLVCKFFGVRGGTPLQTRLSKVALGLFLLAALFAVIVMSANNWKHDKEVIIYAVATGISMIPCALIVVLSITMAVGTQRMRKQQVIVRNMRSVESLGGVTDICSDKTGTLTMGKMALKRAWIPGNGTYSVILPRNTEEFFDPTEGAVNFHAQAPVDIDFGPQGPTGEAINPQVQTANNDTLVQFLNIASLANMATVHPQDEATAKWHSRGDPTEVAIQVFACRFNWNRLTLSTGDNAAWRPIAEFGFNSDVKKMSVIFEAVESQQQWVFTKGALERVLDNCTTAMEGDREVPITDEAVANIMANAKALADTGLRVLSLASRTGFRRVGDDENVEELNREEFESQLTFRGLVGLYDPPRPTTAQAVRACHDAKIRVRMLTGDHPDTARAIAHEVGILPSRSKMGMVAADKAQYMVMAARQFDAMTDDEIDQMPELPLVIARCAPGTKSKMIRALHRRKRWVAMTGDGVNDVSSLKEANVSIAMGIAGAGVTKDVSDIVLADDNFSSILNAVMEGRRMFDNIQRFILHVLSQNLAQAITLLVGLMFKDHTNTSVFPLSPVEILWVLLVTSGFPDMALGMQAAEDDVPRRAPQDLKWSVFTPEFWVDTVIYGIWMGALCLASFIFVLNGIYDGKLGDSCNNMWSDSCETVFRARATCFTVMTFLSLFLAIEVMNLRRGFFLMKKKPRAHTTSQPIRDLWENHALFAAFFAGIFSVFLALYAPKVSTMAMKHSGIGWPEWGVVVVESVIFFLGVEGWKFGKRIYFRRQERANGAHAQDLESRAFGMWLTGGDGDDAPENEKAPSTPSSSA